jgi:hypothetical protein
MKYKYVGTDERVFPSLGITVKKGEEFEAPDNFNATNVLPSNSAKIHIKPTTNTKQESE